MEFTKQKNFFVGIDSDGTVFDSMTIKHTLSFIPAAIEIFELGHCAEVFRKIAERINLYSTTRGINRFPGLLLTFEALRDAGHYDANEVINELSKYVNSGCAFSNDGLAAWLEKNPSEAGSKLMQWSKLGDQYFETLTERIPPYNGVQQAINHMRRSADIMVVSAASAKGLIKDWSNAGLAEKVSFIAGQEFGNKSNQLLYAKSRGYDPSQMLMIGDAPGDYEAAKKAGAWFYPIIPGKESECWHLLANTYFDMFTANKYDQAVENSLYEQFIRFLKGE